VLFEIAENILKQAYCSTWCIPLFETGGIMPGNIVPDAVKITAEYCSKRGKVY
jgi:hypothetical protein